MPPACLGSYRQERSGDAHLDRRGRGASGRAHSRGIRQGGSHAVETALDGRTALTRALVESFDLLVVDRMLPDLEGTQVVKRLRAADIDVPVLMLTVRDQIEDRVEGLDAGADDYLPKPFAFPELLARVRALARRPPEKKAADTVLAVGDVTLNPVRHEVRRGGERIELTAKKFTLLATLVQRPWFSASVGLAR